MTIKFRSSIHYHWSAALPFISSDCHHLLTSPPPHHHHHHPHAIAITMLDIHDFVHDFFSNFFMII
jgi:hypothetical protein